MTSARDAASVLFTASTTGVETSARRAGDEPVARPDRRVGLDEEADDVDLTERRERTVVGALTEQCAGLVHARRVEEDDLGRGGRAHSPDLRARGLRAVGDDRHLPADDLVEQGRLADVRSPDQRHEAGSELASRCRIPVSRSFAAIGRGRGFLVHRRGSTPDDDRDDAPALDPLGTELQPVDMEALAFRGHVARAC